MHNTATNLTHDPPFKKKAVLIYTPTNMITTREVTHTVMDEEVSGLELWFDMAN